MHSEQWSEIEADSIMSEKLFVNAKFLQTTSDFYRESSINKT